MHPALQEAPPSPPPLLHVSSMSAPAPASAAPPASKECWVWRCGCCERDCVPIRSQSRCLCGHRLASHTGTHHACASAGCSCARFFFIVAEGAWVLKCRCKHKHTDHNPSSGAHACKRCSCGGFDSPWVCNCDHPWSQHQQLLVSKQVVKLSDMLARQQEGQEQPQQQPGGASGAAAAAHACQQQQSGTQAQALLVEGDLVCEVNRFEQLRRGKPC